MPLVQISLLEGRDGDSKRALIEQVTDAVVKAASVPRESVRVLLYELPPQHWGVGGTPKNQGPT